MRSDTGTVWECGPSAICEFHEYGGSKVLPCTGVLAAAMSFTPPAEVKTLPEAMLSFEAWLISSALNRARHRLTPGSSHAAVAAKMLGITRQGLLLILDPQKGRHKKLAPLLTTLTKGGARSGRRKKVDQ